MSSAAALYGSNVMRISVSRPPNTPPVHHLDECTLHGNTHVERQRDGAKQQHEQDRDSGRNRVTQGESRERHVNLLRSRELFTDWLMGKNGAACAQTRSEPV